MLETLEFHHLRIAEMFLARATCKSIYMLPRLSFWYHQIGNKTAVIKFQESNKKKALLCDPVFDSA